MRKLQFIFALLMLAALVLGACDGGGAPQQVPAQKPPAQAPVVQAPAATQPPASGSVPDLAGKTITVALENAYPPFNSIDKNTSKGVGWDYDTVTEICKRLNCKPDFKQAAWDGIFPAMQSGEFDVLADGVTITDERKKVVDFSVPYVTVSQVVLQRIDDTITIDGLKADPKKLIGTQIGTTNEIVAKKNFAEAQVKSFEDFGAAVLALLSKDVDGVVIDTVSAGGYMQANPGKMKVGGVLTSDEQLGFVFPPKSPLKAAFDAALQAMMQDGTLEQLNKKWGLVQ
jgi:polar amino acid transport system substrate-binding protein